MTVKPKYFTTIHLLHWASFVTIDKNWNPNKSPLSTVWSADSEKLGRDGIYAVCSCIRYHTSDICIILGIQYLFFYCYSQSHQRSELGVKRDLATVQPLLLKATKHCSMHWLLQLAAAQSCDTKKQNFPSTEQGAAAGAAHCPGRGAPAWRVSWRLAAGSWWRSAERS